MDCQVSCRNLLNKCWLNKLTNRDNPENPKLLFTFLFWTIIF